MKLPRRQSRKRRRLLGIILLLMVLLVLTASNVLMSILLKWPEHPDYQDQLGPFSIHVNWHPKNRRERFPSVQERLRIYMTDWYLPLCEDTASLGGSYRYGSTQQDNGSWPILNITDPWEPSNKTKVVDSLITPDTNLFLDRPIIEDCARSKEQYNDEGKLYTDSRVRARWNMQTYCTEMIVLMDIIDQLDKDGEEGQEKTPIVSYFGDGEGLQNRDSFDIPLFVKHRPIATKEQVGKVAENNATCMKTPTPLETVYHQAMYANRTSPILWKLSSVRHWDVLPEALKGDIPWGEKIDRAYWGGDLTGKLNRSASTDLERCQSSQRCDFVLQHAHSSILDVRLTSRNILRNDTINGIHVVGPKISIQEVEKYKILVSLEGNDLASGLKWSLQSQSVVLMPPPTRTSWAMEELLEPWIHYIPMLPNGSNAEEMVKWVLDHDKEAQRIAERATLFIYDLIYHPDAERDDRMVKEEMARRYRALWH